jgi:Ca2+-binding RTX toxin-like protein
MKIHSSLNSFTRRAGGRPVASTESLEPRRLFAAGITLSDGTLTVTGTAANDTIEVRLEGWTTLVAELNSTTGTFAAGSVRRIKLSGEAGNDTLRVGTGFDQPATLLGGLGADGLFGGDGNDRIDGGAGADVLSGGGGSNTLDYGTRTRPLTICLDNVSGDGEAGEGDNALADFEYVIGGNAADFITGSASKQTIFGNGGNDTLNGGGGNDTLDGRAGNDSLLGGDGNDKFVSNNSADGSDVFWGGEGNDEVQYNSRSNAVTVDNDDVADDGESGERDNVRSDVEMLSGGRGNDRITGSERDDLLFGNAGNDTLSGLGGDDFLSDGAGNDVVYGGDGFDSFSANGDTGNDRLDGGSGNDRIDSGAGADTLLGGPGHDVLDDTSGSNILDGDTGVDRVNGRAESGFLGEPRLLPDGTLVITGTSTSDRIVLEVVDDEVEVRLNEFVIPRYWVYPLSQVRSVVLDSAAGDDRVLQFSTIGTRLNRPLTVRLGDGNDRWSDAEASSGANVDGGAGDDILTGGGGNDRLSGGDGNDVITGGGGRDQLRGNAGNDTLFASGDGAADFLDGGSGTDRARKDRDDFAQFMETLL